MYEHFYNPYMYGTWIMKHGVHHYSKTWHVCMNKLKVFIITQKLQNE